jgi:predicted ABC-type exoprotein transport system permease subunit
VNIVLTVLVAFPLGFFIRSRTHAVVTYVLIDSYLFTFQTAFLLMQWADGNEHAFGARGGAWSAERTTMVFSYLILNGVIVAVGIGLVLLGQKIRSRRTSARDTVAAG